MQRGAGFETRRRPGRYRADWQVAQRVLAGDPAACACFHAFYFPRVHAFASRQQPDRAAAERLTARLLEQVLERLPSFSGGVPLSQWVFGLCVSLTLPAAAASAA